jgi:hypothetical protein
MNTHYRGDAFRIVRGASGARGSPAERLVFVFQCYLDDSGTSGLPIVSMGGFMAPMSQWERLEPLFDAILDRYDVPIFHAKEFHSTKPPFKTWKVVKKKSLIEELFTVAHGDLHGISVGIRRDEYDQAKEENSVAFGRMSGIGVCFASIMAKIITDERISAAVRQQGISFMIETGNQNNSGIEQYFHRMAANPAFEGCLRSISFIPKKQCRAIQLADLLAFYSRRSLWNHARFDGKIALPPCPYLGIIKRHGPVWEIVSRGKPKPTGHFMGKDLHNLDAISALTKRSF